MIEGFSEKKRKKDTESPLIGRRRLLQGLGAAAVVAFVADGAMQRARKKSTEQTDTEQNHTVNGPEPETAWRNPLDAIPNNPKSYATGVLRGHKVAGLLSMYFGLKDGQQIPETLNVDFKRVLADMWTVKYQRTLQLRRETALKKLPLDTALSAEDERSIEIKAQNMAQLGADIVKEYDAVNAKKTSIGQLVSEMQKSIDGVEKKPLYGELCKGMDGACVPLMQKIVESVNSREMLAFMLTEIMPTSDGKRNIEYVSFLLQNAGGDFIERIPALGDSLVSFGPFQLTHFPINEIHRLKVAGQHVPVNVGNVRGVAHVQTAYVFAMINIAKAVKDIQAPEILTNHIGDIRESITSFIATAHHQPSVAIRMFRVFAEDFVAYKKKEEQLKKEGKDISKIVGMPPVPTFHRTLVLRGQKQLAVYSKKTMGNYRHTRNLADENK